MNAAIRTTVAVAAAIATLAGSASAQTSRPGARRLAGTGARSTGHRTTGLVLGAHTIAAPGVTITGPDVDGSFSTTFGAGAGLMVGYGFNERFSSFVSIDLAKQQTGPDVTPEGNWGLAHFEIGARANLPMSGRPSTIPYLSASVGRRALGARVTDFETDETEDVTLSGKMVAIGGGLEHVLTPTLALDGGVELAFGKFDQLDWGGDKQPGHVNGSTSIRMRVGFTWRP